jgi:hypothetical protein
MPAIPIPLARGTQRVKTTGSEGKRRARRADSCGEVGLALILDLILTLCGRCSRCSPADLRRHRRVCPSPRAEAPTDGDGHTVSWHA